MIRHDMSITRARRPSTSSQSPRAKARSLCSAIAAARFLSTSWSERPMTAERTVEEMTSAPSRVTPNSASPAMNAPMTIPQPTTSRTSFGAGGSAPGAGGRRASAQSRRW